MKSRAKAWALASPQAGALLDATDWSATPLGAMSAWPDSLRQAASICLSSRFPMFVWWGDGLIGLYNDAYIPLLGQRHPAAFGRPAQQVWSEIWDVVGPQTEQVMRQGTSTWNERVRLVTQRNGAAEPGWFTWSYSPIFDEDGGVGGLFCACTEDTAQVRAEHERDALLQAARQESIEHARAERLLRASEQRFRSATLLVSSIVWTNDASGRMVGEQHGWQGFTGQSREACQGYGWSDAVHAEDGPATVTAWNEAVARQGEFRHRHRVRRADGQYRVCDIRAVPLLDEQRSVREWVGVHTDITERLAFEQTLQESESRFRDLCDTAPVMIWVTRPDGHCEYLNRGWYDFTGQTPETARGYGWLDAVHPEDRPAAAAAFHRANAAQGPFRIEYRLRRHDGVYCWCIDSAVPRRAPGGEYQGFIGSVIDISERKLAENALETEKRVLQLIATGSPLAGALDAIVTGFEVRSDASVRCAILRLEPSGRTLHVASAPSLPAPFIAALKGWPVGLRAGTCAEAVHTGSTVIEDDLSGPGSPPAVRELALRHGLRGAFSVPLRNAAGEVHGCFTVYARQPGRPSELQLAMATAATHLTGIVLDKHGLDEQLQQSLAAEQAARSEAEHASRMKDEFLATLSHELRTPLSVILGWVALLRRRSELPEDIDRGVTVIERNARAQTQIIADLLDMSAIVSGKVRLELNTIDLQTFAALAVEAIRPTAVANGIAIGFTLDAAHPPSVLADTNRLQQILWNLLSNAVKFTGAGGHIDVSLSVEGAEAVLQVRDDGEGISPDFMVHIFDRFRQADASTTRSRGGLGLGLSIVKKLAELHDGEIEAHSPGLGRGSVFTLRLPVSNPLEMPSGFGRLSASFAAAPLAAVATRATVNPAEAQLHGLRVLLVDDDVDGRETTQSLLEHRRVAVTPAGSAAEALAWLERGSFDAVVSDIGMPLVDGYGLMRQLRAQETRRQATRITAIALTAYARPEDRAKAIDAGFDLHLVKPVDPARLFAALAGVAAARAQQPAPREA